LILILLGSIFRIPRVVTHITTTSSSLFVPTMEPVHNVSSLAIHTDGADVFVDLIHCIRQANQSIVIYSYIWCNDQIGNQIAKELIQAADRGVDVHIVKERYGRYGELTFANKQSFFHTSFAVGPWALCQFLSSSFISYAAYPTSGIASLPCVQTNSPLREKVLQHERIHIEFVSSRNHVKTWIFDQKTLFLGSMNIIDAANGAVSGGSDDSVGGYEINGNGMARGSSGGAEWLEMMLKIENNPELIQQYEKRRQNVIQQCQEETSVNFVWNLNGVVGRMECFDVAVRLLTQASSDIIVLSPFWGAPFVDVLFEKANKGVMVELHLPSRSVVFENMNSWNMVQFLQHPNATVFFSPFMLHAKVAIVDRRYVLVGSANFDESTMVNGEVMVLLTLNASDPIMVNLLSFVQELRDGSIGTADGIQFNRDFALMEYIVSFFL